MEFAFWFSIILMVYIFAGYPLLLIIWKTIFSKKYEATLSIDESTLPNVDVILIVRNVESIIKVKIDSLLSLDYPKNKLKIIIVSDNSTDNAVTIINQLNNDSILCIDNENKSSKSAGINQAIALSDAEILLLTDARQKHEASSLKHLVAHFSDSSIGAVSGELILVDPDTNEFSKGMDAYWRYEKFIRGLESDIDSVPGVTGAIYAMRREFYQPIHAETLLDDVLIPMNLIMNSKKVKFESRAIAYDVPSDDLSREKIRKTRTLAGNWQLLELNTSLLNPFKNPIWFQFMSHKILRLITPMLLLLIFVSNIYILSVSIVYILIFCGQIVAYGLVLASTFYPVLKNFKPLKIWSSFLVLMWFTWLGFWSFITRQHLAIWK